MQEDLYSIGDLVVLTGGEWNGSAGVVSWPIRPAEPGYVLLCSHGQVAGVRVTAAEVTPAVSTSQGFTQLCYQLLKLSSYVIENHILEQAKPVG